MIQTERRHAPIDSGMPSFCIIPLFRLPAVQFPHAFDLITQFLYRACVTVIYCHALEYMVNGIRDLPFPFTDFRKRFYQFIFPCHKQDHHLLQKRQLMICVHITGTDFRKSELFCAGLGYPDLFPVSRRRPQHVSFRIDPVLRESDLLKPVIERIALQSVIRNFQQGDPRKRNITLKFVQVSADQNDSGPGRSIPSSAPGRSKGHGRTGSAAKFKGTLVGEHHVVFSKILRQPVGNRKFPFLLLFKQRTDILDFPMKQIHHR